MIKLETYKDLYEYLRYYKSDNITEWLSINWIGKDKQEVLLRLFTQLNLIDKLNGYKLFDGNFT